MQPKTTQVKDFIISFGIEALKEAYVLSNGKEYKVNLSDDDIEFHSLKNKDWQGDKSRLDRYHMNGNYRFYAINNTGLCVWVYPNTEVYTNSIDSELQALRNAAENIPGMEVHEKPQDDKRKTVGRYFAQLGRTIVSPVLDYENMNYFLLGWIKGSKRN